MGAIRTIGIALGLVAVTLTIYSTMTPYWGVNIDNNMGMQSMQDKAIGLWKACTRANGQSNYQCQSLKQFGIQRLAETGIIGFRILMIIGLIAGMGGLIAGITSSDAVNIAKSSGDKNKAAGGAAGGFLVAGLMVLAATAWAANKIIRQYKNMNWQGSGWQNQAGLQWTLGAAIYAGWCASAIYLGCAAIMFCGCCSGGDDDDEYEVQQAHPHQYAESGYSQGKKEFV